MPTTLRGAVSAAKAEHLTPERAATFARMLSTGIPQLTALAYFDPGYFRSLKVRDRKAWLRRWTGDPLVVAAVNDLNGGEWHDLGKDRRLALATEKHAAELAFFLYTNNFVKAVDDLTLNKMRAAREALTNLMKTGEDDVRNREFMDAIRDIVDGKEGALSPPQLRHDMPTVVVDLGQNIPKERMQG